MSSSLSSRSGGYARSARPTSAAPSRIVVASPLPLIIAAAAVFVSLVLAAVVLLTSSATVKLLGIGIPLVISGAWWLSFIGYVLTPIVVIGCYGWNAIAQRDGLRRNRNFVLRTGYSRGLAWAAGVGIVLGAWHVLNLAVPLSEWLGAS